TFDISFDRITLVGNLIPECEKQVSDFISIDSSVSVLEALSSKFKAQHVLDDIYIEYDKFKGKSLQRKNMRIEFNPNNLDQNSMNWVKDNFVKFMRDIEFSRIDLAFDTELDLSDFFIFSDKSVKKTVFYVEMVSLKRNILEQDKAIDIFGFITKSKKLKIIKI